MADKLIFLGTGTSTGVPQIGCGCEVCTSPDPRDKRLRCSALLKTSSGTLLIDCGPDFRSQMLKLGSPDIDALLVTHSHYDHVGGMDDLRPYCYSHGGFDVYCRSDVARDLRERIPYSFNVKHPDRVPTFHLHEVGNKEFEVIGLEVIPLEVWHGDLPILGYRIGDFAYITDAKFISLDTLQKLQGVETLVINALRIKEHPTHMNLYDTLNVINYIKPKRAFLTHLSHDMGLHASVTRMLPDGVSIATDGMEIDL